jgi:pyrimidine deaminase RibD-like protein
LADDYSLDNESAHRFPEVRLIVDNALLQEEAASNNERRFMELAIEEARQSVGEDGRAHPKVGAVVVRNGTVLTSAHRGELGKGEHAEYTALEKKVPEETVAGTTVYTTLEPCTTRNHPKIPCARRLIERRVSRVVIGMLDPNPAICGKGERLLREHGIVVDRFPHDLILQLEELNRDFTRAQSQVAEERECPKLLLGFDNAWDVKSQINTVGLDPSILSRWLRVRVKNASKRKVAKNCRAFLIGIERVGPEAKKEDLFPNDVRQMVWTHDPPGSPSARDLLPGVDNWVDVVAAIDGQKALLVCVRPSWALGTPGDYLFTVQVSAEDADCEVIKVEVHWDGTWQSLRGLPVSDSFAQTAPPG